MEETPKTMLEADEFLPFEWLQLVFFVKEEGKENNNNIAPEKKYEWKETKQNGERDRDKQTKKQEDLLRMKLKTCCERPGAGFSCCFPF